MDRLEQIKQAAKTVQSENKFKKLVDSYLNKYYLLTVNYNKPLSKVFNNGYQQRRYTTHTCN